VNSWYSPPVMAAIVLAMFFFIALRAIIRVPTMSGGASMYASSLLLPRSVSNTCDRDGENASAYTTVLLFPMAATTPSVLAI